MFEAKLVFSNQRTEDGGRRTEGVNLLCSGFRLPLSDHENNQVSKGYLVDALALRGDEGRGTLR